MTGATARSWFVLALVVGCTEAPEPRTQAVEEKATDATSEPSSIAEMKSDPDTVPPAASEAETGSDPIGTPETSPSERRTFDDPGGGTSLTRTAHIREIPETRTDARRPRRDGAPHLQIVALGTDLMVRLVNDRPRTAWISTHPPAPGPEPRMFIELVAEDARGDSWTTRDVAGCGGTAALIKIPPWTTIDLGRARAFVAHAEDHDDWLRIVFEDDAMAQTTGTRARVHARWSGSPPRDPPDDQTVARLREMYRDAADLELEDLFVMSTNDTSNIVEIVAEPDAGVIHPREPTAERLRMPEDLRETARELGLE